MRGAAPDLETKQPGSQFLHDLRGELGRGSGACQASGNRRQKTCVQGGQGAFISRQTAAGEKQPARVQPCSAPMGWAFAVTTEAKVPQEGLVRAGELGQALRPTASKRPSVSSSSLLGAMVAFPSGTCWRKTTARMHPVFVAWARDNDKV